MNSARISTAARITGRSRASIDWIISQPTPGQAKTVSTTTEPPSSAPN